MIDKSINVLGNVQQSNLNTGKNVKQTMIINQDIDTAEKAFSEVNEDITKIHDEGKRKLAEYMAGQLREAYNNNDSEKAKEPFGFLRGILGDVGSIASIASLFGFSLI
ncbi:hypothetical protein [Cytobacillus firmus]|uniref:Uncharacterized protein n=1 Tax=Cytobacillus firmus DS1 TaxID=1307436 RepID=W7LC11_CYTFI|nr:hypothetical protein [Cytobacillus firmus]EWG12706.1 hypothetical protein PBF_04185 [Cytobacillus firmus DS1]